MKPEAEGHEDLIYRIDRGLDKVVHVTTIALRSVTEVVLVALAFLIFIYVIGRATFNIPWLFVEEFTAYGLVLLTFFSLAYALRSGRHIKVDLAVRQLSKRRRSIVKVSTDCIALLLVAYLTMRGVEWFWYGFVKEVHSAAPSHVLVWPFYLLVPIGLAVLDLALLQQVYHGIIGLVRGGESNER